MTQDMPRQTRRRWIWTLIGLIQIGNAAAFGAVATSFDFGEHDNGGAVANADDESESVATDATPSGVTVTSESTPGAVEDHSATESTVASSAAPDAANADDAAGREALPTFAVEPWSPLAESVPWTTSRTPSAVDIVDTSPDAPATHDEPTTTVEPSPSTTPAIENANDAGLTVRCLVNGELVELKPGERRELTGGDTWVVRFHRGGQYGAAREVLYGGEHRFVVGAQGWRLEPLDASAARPARGD